MNYVNFSTHVFFFFFSLKHPQRFVGFSLQIAICTPHYIKQLFPVGKTKKASNINHFSFKIDFNSRKMLLHLTNHHVSIMKPQHICPPNLCIN